MSKHSLLSGGPLATGLALALLFSWAALLRGQSDQPLVFRNSAQTIGDFSLSAEQLDFVRDHDPHRITFTFENKSDKAVEITAVFSSADTVRPLDDSGKQVESVSREQSVAAGQSVALPFQFAALPENFNAHYPLRLVVTAKQGENSTRLEAIRVIETRFENQPPTEDDPARTVLFKGLSLLERPRRVWLNLAGEDLRCLGVDFLGSDEATRANCRAEGDHFSLHPPFVPKGGSLWLEYPLQMPDSESITFSYGCMIRQNNPNEPVSDGVTFRVWGTEGDFESKKLLDEIHTDAKTWQNRVADLSSFASKAMTLWIEINPGPKNNTTCDGCSIRGLTLSALAPPAKEPAADPVEFALADGFTARVAPGEQGLFDAAVTLTAPDGRRVTYQGISIFLDGISPAGDSALIESNPQCRYDAETKRLNCRTTLVINDRPETITLSVYELNGLLIVEVPEGNPAKIGPLSLGPGSGSIERFYYGHGMVCQHPTASLRIDGEGHRLSTSHVGVDYANGLSLLIASETPPDYLSIDPQTGLFTLEVSGVARLALRPSEHGAFDAAIHFRDQSPWHAAPGKGVARKAGRLVFDVWNAAYADNVGKIEKAFAYGVTDALFVDHVWQRWGYDVKLPDIWGAGEADAVSGSFKDLRALVDLCLSRDVPFALHDNYIDFYPDAEGFTYDDIVFHREGTPTKAWINHGAQAQSYRFCPHLIFPFLERNMVLCKKFLPEVDAYFIDVLSSIHMFPYYDRAGNFHPLLETRDSWKRAFEQVGRALSHEVDGELQTAITISEAGNDFLIGSLDGADAQWIPISSVPASGTYLVPCESWERTPWFAAVNHTNYSRHGVGYEGRYIAMSNAFLHGTESDDYLSMEVLGGVDLMVDAQRLFPASVRAHYLAQHIVRSRAAAEILSVEFAGDDDQKDIARQIVRWSDGTTVFGNRGADDWLLPDGSILPRYGVKCVNPNGMELFIGRNPENPDEVIEYSRRSDGSFYLNGRGYPSQRIYAVTPRLASGEVLPDGKIAIALEWDAEEPLPEELRTFVHVFEPLRGYGHKPKGWFCGGSAPAVATTEWGSQGNKTIRTDETTIVIPDDIPSGHYEILAGLFNENSHYRYPLIGNSDNQGRYAVASLDIVRKKDGQCDLTITPLALREDRDLFLRNIGNKTPAAIGPVSTLGALYVTPGQDTWRLLPIPAAESFEVTIDEQKLGRPIDGVSFENGGEKSSVPLRRDGERVTFTVEAKDAIWYTVTLK
ncbi:MAG: hypothetical protein IJH68_05060 [Thermoguttaceae bacterium]|nr:hypothetical protein [Thermoguttaceae bacterium]